MNKQYTITTFKRNWETKNVDAYCYYWKDEKRELDIFPIYHKYFYADLDVPFSENDFRIIKGFKSVHGKNVNKIIPKILLSHDDYKQLQEEYKGRIYETDVRPIDRWMWEEKPKFTKDLRKWYLDIEILRDENGQYSPVTEASNKVSAITLYDSFCKKYFVFLLSDKNEKLKKDNRSIYIFDSEINMLNAFLKAVDQLQPDLITGWNTNGFDIPYLINRMEKVGIDYNKLSPLNSVYIKAKIFKSYLSFRLGIRGRGLLDLMEVCKQFWMGTDVGYSLEAISQKFLGEGKIKIGDIDKCYREDFWRFVDYNVKDVELCVRLDEQFNLILDMQAFQDFISINLEETPVAGKIINSYIKQHTDIVLTDSFSKPDFDLPGGYVVKPAKGIFRDIRKFDFASHYPSIIRSYNISPDMVVNDPKEEDKKNLIYFSCRYRYVTEKGTTGWQILLPHEKITKDVRFFEVWFRKDARGSITSITDELTETRLKYKRDGDKSRSTVLKRMINSIFGQLGYKYSRFFNDKCAMAVTLLGQYYTKSIIHEIETNGVGIAVMGDTDSFAIDLVKGKTNKDVIESAHVVFNRATKEHNLGKMYSDLELEDEIDKMILFGTKKKYAQLINGKNKIMGLELIRKDFPEAIKDFQRMMIQKIFDDDNTGLKDLQKIRKEVEDRIRSKINLNEPEYYSMPTVIRKPIYDYAFETAEKKALRNSNLKISVNEGFYILPCVGGNDLAFKSKDELTKFSYKPDYDRILGKVFKNIGIFEDLFIKQTTLGQY